MEEQIQPVRPVAPKSSLAKIIAINAVIALMISIVISLVVSSMAINKRFADIDAMQKKVEALTGKINIR